MKQEANFDFLSTLSIETPNPEGSYSIKLKREDRIQALSEISRILGFYSNSKNREQSESKACKSIVSKLVKWKTPTI